MKMMEMMHRALVYYRPVSYLHGVTSGCSFSVSAARASGGIMGHMGPKHAMPPAPQQSNAHHPGLAILRLARTAGFR